MTAEARYIPTGKLIRCPECGAEINARADIALTLEALSFTAQDEQALADIQRSRNHPYDASLRASEASEQASAYTREDVVNLLERGERLPTKPFNALVNLAKQRGWYWKYGKTLQEILPKLWQPEDIHAVEQAVNE